MEDPGPRYLIDISNATVLERAVLMLIERVESLERQAADAELRASAMAEDLEKAALKQAICASMGKAEVAENVFAFFLGIPPHRFKNVRIDERCGLLRTTANAQGVPPRASEIAIAYGRRPVWDGSLDDSAPGDGVSRALDAMSLQELRAFWQWRMLTSGHASASHETVVHSP